MYNYLQELQQTNKDIEMRNITTFLTTKTPMAKARAEKALLVQVRVNGGSIMTRKELIEKRVAEGSFMAQVGGETVLKNKDGSFAMKSDFTKTAIDYAEHLIG